MAPPKRILNDSGLIRIRFTHRGIRYNLSRLGSISDPVAVRYAQSIVDRICLDISNNSFNCCDSEDLLLRYNPSILVNISSPDKAPKSTGKKQGEDLRSVAIDILSTRSGTVDKIVCGHLKKYSKKITNKEEAEVFLSWLKIEHNLSSSSVARYLDVLKTVDSLFKQIHVEVESKPNAQAFTREEVELICGWFKDNRYCNYVRFLFLTGCRISEAIGLRWKHIDFNQGTIHFYETLARDEGYTSKRVVKTTKKNIMRHFPINSKLAALFNEVEKGLPDDLVFLVSGRCINDKNFCNRDWKRCLKECGITYRKPSLTRHTFISHYLEQTKDVVKCASLTHGSKRGVQTIFEHYASIINKVEVPDLY